jgi:hypothetical protein
MAVETERRWGPVLILAAAALGVFAGAIFVELLQSDDGALAEFDIPPRGVTVAEYLPNGTPVFVIHALNGEISVVRAISAHIESDRMGWCPSSRTIEDLDHGARWNERGSYVSGPAPTDLVTYAYDLHPGLSLISVTRELTVGGRSDEQQVGGPPCEPNEFLLHPG